MRTVVAALGPHRAFFFWKRKSCSVLRHCGFSSTFGGSGVGATAMLLRLLDFRRRLGCCFGSGYGHAQQGRCFGLETLGTARSEEPGQALLLGGFTLLLVTLKLSALPVEAGSGLWASHPAANGPSPE